MYIHIHTCRNHTYFNGNQLKISASPTSSLLFISSNFFFYSGQCILLNPPIRNTAVNDRVVLLVDGTPFMNANAIRVIRDIGTEEMRNALRRLGMPMIHTVNMIPENENEF